MQGAKETARGERGRGRGDCSCIDRLLEQSIDMEQQQQIALMSHAGSCSQHTRLQAAMKQGKGEEKGGERQLISMVLRAS